MLHVNIAGSQLIHHAFSLLHGLSKAGFGWNFLTGLLPIIHWQQLRQVQKECTR